MCNYNKHNTAIRHAVRIEMELKLNGLLAKEKELTEKLEARFDEDTFRALNIIAHKIEVTELRKEGGWLDGDYLQCTEMAVKNSF
jgi:hypothetical protein